MRRLIWICAFIAALLPALVSAEVGRPVASSDIPAACTLPAQVSLNDRREITCPVVIIPEGKALGASVASCTSTALSREGGCERDVSVNNARETADLRLCLYFFLSSEGELIYQGWDKCPGPER